jgi:esterase
MTVERFRSGALELAFRRVAGRAQAPAGPAPAVPAVFVHGLSFFSYDWVPIAEALGREAACLDMRGFGDSGWAKDYSIPAMAADIGALLDHLGWARALVVGHSMGGRNAAYFAAKNPARVAGLALIDYSPEIAPAGSKRVAQTVAGVPEVFPTIDAAMAHFKAGPEKRARFEAYLRPVEGGYAIKRDPYFRDQFRKALETGERPQPGVDMWQALGELAMPTLVVRGARSDLFAAGTVAQVKAANARIRLVEVDAGHNVAGDDAQGLVAALRAFAATL